MFDYHHHSESSVDSETPMCEICAAALDRGVDQIAFTEHVDFIPEERNTGYFDYDSYMRHVEHCRREFAGRIEILAAVEIDYCPDFEDEIERWLRGRELDFVIGSVHYIRGKGNISEPRSVEYFAGRPVEEAYAEYFDLVARSAASGLWDALGHLDLVKRYGVEQYGPFDPALFAPVVDGILSDVIRHGMALEVNTSGLRQVPEETYPGPAILKRYRELGGERVTIGSDSHDAVRTGSGIHEGLRLLREAGFDRLTGYGDREPYSVPLPSGELRPVA